MRLVAAVVALSAPALGFSGTVARSCCRASWVHASHTHPSRVVALLGSRAARNYPAPSQASGAAPARATPKLEPSQAKPAAKKKKSAASAWAEMLVEFKRSRHRRAVGGKAGVAAPSAPAVPAEALVVWAEKQRAARAKGKLSKFRQKELVAAGFKWNDEDALHGGVAPSPAPAAAGAQKGKPGRRRASSSAASEAASKGNGTLSASAALWERGFKMLLEYRDGVGDGSCKVPNSYVGPQAASQGVMEDDGVSVVRGGGRGGVKLGRWVERQRASRAAGRLSPEREARLTQAGFCWDPQGEEWEDRRRLLEAFASHHGHANVPQHHFVLTTETRRWGAEVGEAGVEEAVALSRAPAGGSKAADGMPEEEEVEVVVQLGSWVHTQRLAGARGALSDDRRQALDALGFVW